MGFTCFYYKGFSFVPCREELAVFKSGELIATHPINTSIMDYFDIVEIIDEVLEM